VKKSGKTNPEPLMRRDITYIQGVQMEEAVEIVRHCSFRDEEMEVIERILRSPEEFHNVYMDWIRYWHFERCISELHAFTKKESFFYYGNCDVCNSPQPFIVDYRFAETENDVKKINWRERLVCPNCGCNSRQRYSARQIFKAYEKGKKILLYEQNSEVFRKVQREISEIQGFDYPGSGHQEKKINGVDTQDICALEYPDESFDLIISNDVFEHVYDYEQAFKEAYRVLRTGGKMIFTVPFDGNSIETARRVEMDEANVIYTADKYFHGNPVPGLEKEPLLVYQIFGWDMIDILRRCGFRDAYGKTYYGLKKAYMGYLPVYFEALK